MLFLILIILVPLFRPSVFRVAFFSIFQFIRDMTLFRVTLSRQTYKWKKNFQNSKQYSQSQQFYWLITTEDLIFLSTDNSETISWDNFQSIKTSICFIYNVIWKTVSMVNNRILKKWENLPKVCNETKKKYVKDQLLNLIKDTEHVFQEGTVIK